MESLLLWNRYVDLGTSTNVDASQWDSAATEHILLKDKIVSKYKNRFWIKPKGYKQRTEIVSGDWVVRHNGIYRFFSHMAFIQNFMPYDNFKLLESVAYGWRYSFMKDAINFYLQEYKDTILPYEEGGPLNPIDTEFTAEIQRLFVLSKIDLSAIKIMHERLMRLDSFTRTRVLQFLHDYIKNNSVQDEAN